MNLNELIACYHGVKGISNLKHAADDLEVIISNYVTEIRKNQEAELAKKFDVCDTACDQCGLEACVNPDEV